MGAADTLRLRRLACPPPPFQRMAGTHVRRLRPTIGCSDGGTVLLAPPPRTRLAPSAPAAARGKCEPASRPPCGRRLDVHRQPAHPPPPSPRPVAPGLATETRLDEVDDAACRCHRPDGACHELPAEAPSRSQPRPDGWRWLATHGAPLSGQRAGGAVGTVTGPLRRRGPAGPSRPSCPGPARRRHPARRRSGSSARRGSSRPRP